MDKSWLIFLISYTPRLMLFLSIQLSHHVSFFHFQNFQFETFFLVILLLIFLPNLDIQVIHLLFWLRYFSAASYTCKFCWTNLVSNTCTPNGFTKWAADFSLTLKRACISSGCLKTSFIISIVVAMEV